MRGTNHEPFEGYLKEAALMFESIGKLELAATCYCNLREYERAVPSMWLSEYCNNIISVRKIYVSTCGKIDAAEYFTLAGCYSEAVEAYTKGDQFSHCLLFCLKGNFLNAAVIARAARGDGNRGWPLKQFDQMEEICNKVKSLAKMISKGFYEFVCSELKIITDQRKSLAELKKDLHDSQENGSFMGEILSIRKIMDAYFHCHFSKYNWEDKILFDFDEYSGKIFETQISVRTLYSYWLTIYPDVEVFFDLPNVDVLDGGYLDLTLSSPMLKI
ncbi:hypothetical protein Tco_1344458 [Tanacetum coccineum]